MRDTEADKLLNSISQTNSLAVNYGYLEINPGRRFQFPAAGYKPYLADLLLFDPLAITGEQVDIGNEKDYQFLSSDSFLYLLARSDLVQKYDTKSYISQRYKDYDQNQEYLLVANPDNNSYNSGLSAGIPLEINS